MPWEIERDFIAERELEQRGDGHTRFTGSETAGPQQSGKRARQERR
jgi:hypothetical protein